MMTHDKALIDFEKGLAVKKELDKLLSDRLISSGVDSTSGIAILMGTLMYATTLAYAIGDRNRAKARDMMGDFIDIMLEELDKHKEEVNDLMARSTLIKLDRERQLGRSLTAEEMREVTNLASAQVKAAAAAKG